MEVLIVTGLSGAGKSNAMNCLEDMGYYCIDNMPPVLLKSFQQLEEQKKIVLQKAAFIMDIRGGEFFNDLEKVLEDLKKEGKYYKVLFLEASDDVLVRRYKETRRIHPLSDGCTDMEAIQKERRLLKSIRESADYVIDTTNLKPAQLQSKIQSVLFEEEPEHGFKITVMSFGYKHGMAMDADVVFDVRFIPNPYYLEEMREMTGNDAKVREYVMSFEETQTFVNNIVAMIEYLIPYYMKQGKRNLIAAFGCTGGQHRSVSMANEFYDIFKEHGRKVDRFHRDVMKR